MFEPFRTPRSSAALSVLTASLLAFALPAGAADVPTDLSFQGRLLDNAGNPLPGPADIEIRLYGTMAGGTQLFRELHQNVPLNNGTFSLIIGTGDFQVGTLDATVLDALNRYLEVVIDAEALTPRLPLSSVPYSLRAQQAEEVGGLLAVDLITSVGTNASDVATNTAAISSNQTAIATNAAADATNAAAIATNAGDITSNAISISANSENVATNTGNITSNTSSISANSANIATNTSGIAANGTAIASFTSALDSFFGGDGSAGDLTVSVGTDWNSSPPANPNFGNITIQSGQTLTVPAGTTIRCAGNFLNSGTLSVLHGVKNSARESYGTLGPSWPMISIAHPGDAPSTATRGDWHTNNTADPKSVSGGIGGSGIPQVRAIMSFDRFRIGGGSGAGHAWGDGGGLVRIYCRGSIVNAGTISAVGRDGWQLTGGGGGGIAILASRTLVDNTGGTIDASGGDGGPADWVGGYGGGGGGGIVMFIAPVVSTAGGTVNIAGGAAGTSGGPVTNDRRTGGGGGGASGGSGGSGGGVSSNGTVYAAVSGSAGYEVSLSIDPAYSLH